MLVFKDDLPVKQEYVSQRLKACLTSSLPVLSSSECFFKEKDVKQFSKIQYLWSAFASQVKR